MSLRIVPAPLEVQSNLTVLPVRELDDLDHFKGVSADPMFRIGLLIPMCGSAGIWAPSCISSAQVAVMELNRKGGIDGRPVELIMIDAALEAPSPVEQVVNSLIDIKAIDAIVGMHISAVRQQLSKIVQQRVPYVYTPLYEGGERTRGIFAIGDTPDLQLGPALDHFHHTHTIKRWALIGNDYVWPRSSNVYAKQKLKSLGSRVVCERYLPFGVSNMHCVIEEMHRCDADAVLISLVGQDAITFNRAFGETRSHRKMLRFSCAIEENGLLASGAENLVELYSAASYFGSVNTRANCNFKEKYYGLHGENAPVLNALGQSTYEGIQFLSGLFKHHRENWRNLDTLVNPGIDYASVRRCDTPEAGGPQAPIYLAKANGLQFDIVKTF